METSKRVILDEVCGKQAENFTSTRAFQNHHRNHAEEDITCGQCGKKLKNQQKMQAHAFEVHNSDKTCKECPKTFSKYSNLKKHEDSHKHPVTCEKCLKLMTHIQTKHEHYTCEHS